MPVSFTFQQLPHSPVFIFSLEAGSLHRKTPATCYFRVCFSCRKLPQPNKYMPLRVGMHPMTDCTRLLIFKPNENIRDTPIMFFALHRTIKSFLELVSQSKCIMVQVHPLFHFAFLFSLHRGGSLMYIQDAEVHLSVCLYRMPCWEVLVKVRIWPSCC